MKVAVSNSAVSAVAVWSVSVAVLAGLLALATLSSAVAVVAVGLAVGLVVLVCFDLQRTGALLVTLAMFLAPMNDIRLGASYVTASDIVFVLGFAVLTPTVLRQRFTFPPLFMFGLAILLVMGVLASVASPITFVSANQVARLMIGAFGLPIFFMMWRPASHLIVRFATAYIFGAVVSVMWALAEGPVGGGRYIGFTYHPNYFGLASLLGASLVPFVVAKVAPGHRWILWGAGAISAFGVYLSGSRAALVVLIMLIVIYPFVEQSVRAVGVVALGVTGALAFSGRLLSEDSETNALGRLFGSGTASGSDEERQQILSEAWVQFKQHPLLGSGFDGGLGSHNIYLQVAVAVGVFGLVGYLMILWAAVRPLFWKGINHRLAYPVLAYGAIGPLTNTLWDRLIWAVVALSFAANVGGPVRDDPTEGELAPVDDETMTRGGAQ